MSVSWLPFSEKVPNLASDLCCVPAGGEIFRKKKLVYIKLSLALLFLHHGAALSVHKEAGSFTQLLCVLSWFGAPCPIMLLPGCLNKKYLYIF